MGMVRQEMPTLKGEGHSRNGAFFEVANGRVALG